MIKVNHIQQTLKHKRPAYEDGLDHLSDELIRLDAILARRVELFNREISETDSFVRAAPNYVTFDEVEFLLNEKGCSKEEADLGKLNDLVAEWNQRLAKSIKHSEDNQIDLPLANLAQRFNLNGIESAIVIICLAPEMNRKYDRIYAYLQDNISRKRPSIDLVMRVLFDNERDRWQARLFFEARANLFQHNIIEVVEYEDSETGTSELASYLKIDRRILSFVMGFNQLDSSHSQYAQLKQPEEDYIPNLVDGHCAREVLCLINDCMNSADANRLWLSFLGCGGKEKLWMALDCIREYADSLLVIDCQELVKHGAGNVANKFKNVCREAILQQVPIYLEHASALFDQALNFEQEALISTLMEYTWLVFSDAEVNQLSVAEKGGLYHRLHFNIPSACTREEQWHYVLSDFPCIDSNELACKLAHKYKMMPEQIVAVASKAYGKLAISADNQLSENDFFLLCRQETAGTVDTLATRIKSHYSWDDLVLPEEEKKLLAAICRQVSNQTKVFDNWGFSKKLAYGTGLSVLFTGKPGTGKTMACQVVGNQLGLDVYKVDLSKMVSKYIGETEKNLDKIFAAAASSNAILFFDEADALFGKRSEVNDAHDRYANIETSYLLQKIEDYDGIVVLATNFKNNIDSAFMRRCRFVLEFPFPESEQRKAIWKKTLPDDMPLDSDLDFDWLAKQINLPGGNIKNIVLNAAFYAAEEDKPLNMRHFQLGSRDEYKKIGRLWDQRIMTYRVQ